LALLNDGSADDWQGNVPQGDFDRHPNEFRCLARAGLGRTDVLRADRPPLHLRLLLPLPIRTSGSKSEVGDEATCLYAGGYLLKRVTQIEPCRLYGFAVVEQNLTIGGGLMLAGGCYTLRELPSRRTEVAVTTRYVSNKRPGWLWKPIEATVCHLFHRHLLSAMRRKVESY
jgi:hypothetical protein